MLFSVMAYITEMDLQISSPRLPSCLKMTSQSTTTGNASGPPRNGTFFDRVTVLGGKTFRGSLPGWQHWFPRLDDERRFLPAASTSSMGRQ